ncbi:MAG: fimbrial protein [Fibrobacter sp.]|nr:fimbrial protein [Fibrobacter sp.]
MKNAFTSILLLTVVGLAVLLAGATYFGAPLFGWVIMAAIFVVFIVEQVSALKKTKQIAAETEVLETCESRGSYSVAGDGVVAERFKLARKLLSKNVRLDSPIAYEVLSNSVSISVPRSAGGSVILLGLMGTFFGLMYSVATAGGAIDNSTTQGTLDTIQLLFQGMKGIFGTSLCGLFAALILNASRSLLVSARDSFMARLDALTLNMQGDSADEEQQSKNELERLFESVEQNLKSVTAAVQAGLVGVVNKVGEELSATTAKMNQNVAGSVEKVSAEMSASVKNLNEALSSAMANMNSSMQNLGSSVSASLTGAFTPMEQSVKALSSSVESIPAKLDDKLNGLSANMESALSKVASDVKSGLDCVASDVKAGLDGVASAAESAMAGTTQNIAASVSDQVKQSNEQWNSFMQRLEERATSNVDAQREGLETLKNVALQVAEKAQAGSAELSASVSEKLGALSNDILDAFQKLSETSAVLLEAQKALTVSIDERVVKEKEATDALGGNIVETAELMRVNQSELSANLEMLRAGLETILEKLSGDTAEHEEEENFVEHLNQSLEAFHERASEVLMENAVKTQEILLEVLEQTQRASASSVSAAPAVEEPKVEG